LSGIVKRWLRDVEILNTGTGGLFMTVRLVIMIATLASLGVLACPAAGISKTRVLSLGGDAPGFGDPSADSRCCSVEDSTLALGILEDWKIEVEAPPAPDGNATASGTGPNQESAAAPAVQTDPGTADLEAAGVAAPPQSGLRRMLSAVIDFGSVENSKR
jgi:hypothetical protein